MANVFDEILTKGVRAGQIPARTKKARNWYRETAKQTSVNNKRGLITGNKEDTISASKFTIGQMYFFNYSPKHKATLPYYDSFPLVFPIGPADRGFLGLNLHYLPFQQRAVLMDALYSLKTDRRYDENTRLALSYDVLKGASKYKFFKPTIKRYLYQHVKSRLLEINATDWDTALFLPLASFKKASAAEVWQDSIRKS